MDSDTHLGLDTPASPTADRPPAPNQWVLSAFWFSLNFQSAALLTILIPETLTRLAGAYRTAELARLAALSALLAMVVPPVVGLWSDRLRAHGLGRRPVVLAGTAVNVGGLLLIPFSGSLTGLTVSVIVALVGQGAATAAYQAMMPEAVPRDRWGRASGYMGVTSLAGTVSGLLVAGVTSPAVAYVLMAGTGAAGAALTAAGVRERREVPDRAPSVRIQDFRRFGWVFAARFWVLFGQTLLMTFVLYFFEDVLNDATPAAGTALVAGFALGGAALSTFWLGQASDRRDRARVVAWATVPMAVAAAGFGLAPRLNTVYMMAVLWGVGYGAFLSVDWALALDVIPDLANVARDLGIWGIASNLPAVIAPLVGADILGAYTQPFDGYRMLFLAAGASFLLGGVLVLPLRAERPRVPGWVGGLALFVAALLKVYVALAYEVRVVGRLPRPRNGLLVVGNHFANLEGMVLPVALLWSDPWAGPVVSAGSRRMFEPGFLATRLPKWLGRWLTPVNLSRVLKALGVHPIEDRPLNRPLSSWAYLVYSRYGNLPAQEVLEPDYCPPGAERLADLWRCGQFPQDGPFTSHRALREPYRTAVRTGVRDELEQDLRAIETALRHGATVYLTPEGRMTPTGEMGRFRLAWDRLHPEARAVYLASTACDPWTHRRMALVTRLLPLGDPARLRLELPATRPVTPAHIVAAALATMPGGGPVSELMARMRRLVRAARDAGAWLTPETAAVEAWAPKTLQRLARRGIIRVAGDRVEPGPVRQDGRLSHVPDLPDALAAQFRETLEALRVLESEARAAQ
jgi:MFS family permease